MVGHQNSQRMNLPRSLSHEIDHKWHFESLVTSPTSLQQRRRVLEAKRIERSKRTQKMPRSDLCESSRSAEDQEQPTADNATSSTMIPKASEHFLKTFQDVFNDSDSELDEFCKIFKIFDRNGDGMLSTDEIVELLDKFGLKMTEKELASMMAAVDKNRNGFVDLEEFLSLYITNYDEGIADFIEEHDEESLKRAFRVFDQNRDGYITAKELQTVLSNLGLLQDTRLVDCRNMIRGADLDGDGQINFMEFKIMMSNKRSRCSAKSGNSLDKSLSTIQVSACGKARDQF
ncbi:hypothetical protein O6H91_17G082400 [Diphasiastrum complanatum]|uniref:Uncharacterized protein n=1 Tax=Diphasiastrum complanatum TaxID=34168 RepID=A0ACC2B9L9_DIPCM|nr:hypothetical protein O6H91_17G082400 [Diphasiastrum complanatum]